MKKESNEQKLVSAIRSDIEYIKKYESFLRGFDDKLKDSVVNFKKKFVDSDLTEEDMVEYGIENFSEKNFYLSDIKILYTRVVNYYKALIIIGHKDLLKEDEVSTLEGLYTKLPNVNFVFDEKGDIKEKVKGFLEKVKDSIRKGDVKKDLLRTVKLLLDQSKSK